MNVRLIIASVIASSLAGPVWAQTGDTAKSLDDLLERVKKGWRTENEELKRREEEFLAERANRPPCSSKPRTGGSRRKNAAWHSSATSRKKRSKSASSKRRSRLDSETWASCSA
jgi:hypothetical protein